MLSDSSSLNEETLKNKIKDEFFKDKNSFIAGVK